MTEVKSDGPWSVSVRLDEIPDLGKHVVLTASDEVRAALAKPVAVDAVERLVAEFDVTRHGRDSVHVSGVVRATVRQSCVVTFELVLNEINEEIEVDFAPPRVVAPRSAADPDDEDMEQSSPDEPEPLIGNSIDLGALATEFLTLGVDPYPRKAGVSFEAPQATDSTAARPFDALAGWSKKGTVKE
jgi:hypothetical protein